MSAFTQTKETLKVLFQLYMTALRAASAKPAQLRLDLAKYRAHGSTDGVWAAQVTSAQTLRVVDLRRGPYVASLCAPYFRAQSIGSSGSTDRSFVLCNGKLLRRRLQAVGSTFSRPCSLLSRLVPRVVLQRRTDQVQLFTMIWLETCAVADTVHCTSTAVLVASHTFPTGNGS